MIGRGTWILLVLLWCFILATLPLVWPIWVTVVVFPVVAIVPGVLFANKVHYGNYFVFPWSHKIVIPKTLVDNDRVLPARSDTSTIKDLE